MTTATVKGSTITTAKGSAMKTAKGSAKTAKGSTMTTAKGSTMTTAISIVWLMRPDIVPGLAKVDGPRFGGQLILFLASLGSKQFSHLIR
ncbi:hypothetical protein RHSIM_Rhsim02G0013900 [Rhododendron simsii]|uniref:Uncharacterized protein n=1 Tax=Rhododendron simsii TaxID=118357 RepID=A0A834HA51_RHOSS|nr:hypothetical protein RHSIM_Rhsim02G0013900 [Rhododendron simsii]